MMQSRSSTKIIQFRSIRSCKRGREEHRGEDWGHPVGFCVQRKWHILGEQQLRELMVQPPSCQCSVHKTKRDSHNHRDQGHLVGFCVQMRQHSRDGQQLQELMVQLLSCPNSDHRLVLGIHSRKDQGHPVDFFVQMRWHSRDEQQLQGEMPRLQVRQQRGRRGKQAQPLKFKAVLFVIIRVNIK